MTTTYTQRQIMLSFAYIAYTDELLPGIPSPDAQIKTDIEAALSATATNPILPVAGQWSIVWGPVSYTVPGSYYQDNLMYVVKLNGNNSAAQYAVAVRGTNGKVLLDWLLEDLDIIQMMPWPLGSSGSAIVGNISESTSIGITILLHMQDAETGMTLLQFLVNEMSNLTLPLASICFTGHSLGATLSSTLALYMRENQPTWDPGSKAIVTAINFAGPTAGDQNFADYFNQHFVYSGTSPLTYWQPPSLSLVSYADCVRTSLDIAPRVWNAASMGTIEGIYLGHLLDDIYPPLGTAEIIGYIKDATSANQFMQIQATQLVVTGTFLTKSELPTNLSSIAWIAEAEYQHSASYPTILGVPSLLTNSPSPVPLMAPAKGIQ